MPNEFLVVGEHREDKSQFLLLGADGAYYGYDPASERIALTEPDEQWELLPDFEGALAATPTEN
jgi:hypothetical protein